MLLAASRAEEGRGGPDTTVRSLIDDDARVGLHDPLTFSALQRTVYTSAGALRDWLAGQRSAQSVVVGYGAASRAVALLRRAGVDRTFAAGDSGRISG